MNVAFLYDVTALISELSWLTAIPRKQFRITRRLHCAFGFYEAVKSCNVIPLTAERRRPPDRGNLTEQFKSVRMKFNPHSSPPPVRRLIYSQVHSAAASGGGGEPGRELSGFPSVLHVFEPLTEKFDASLSRCREAAAGVLRHDL